MSHLDGGLQGEHTKTAVGIGLVKVLLGKYSRSFKIKTFRSTGCCKPLIIEGGREAGRHGYGHNKCGKQCSVVLLPVRDIGEHWTVHRHIMWVTLFS